MADQDIRRFVDRMAEEARFDGAVPPRMLRRARVRRIRTALAGLAVVAVAASGAVVGVGTLTRKGPTTGSPIPTPAPSTPVPAPKAIPTTLTVPWQPLAPTPALTPIVSAARCTAQDLRVSVALEGATQSLAGPVQFTNRSKANCQLSGRPDIALVGASGQALPLSVTAGQASVRWPTQPVVEIKPAETAIAILVWRDWCGGSLMDAAWRVVLAGVGSFDVPYREGGAVPSRGTGPVCNVPGSPSTLSVSPVTPRDLEPKWPLSPVVQQTLSAAPGTELRYVVILYNAEGSEYRFPDGCPGYTETATLPRGLRVTHSYTLDCRSAGVVPANMGAAFEMVLAIPADATPGTGQLKWALDPPWGTTTTWQLTITPG